MFQLPKYIKMINDREFQSAREYKRESIPAYLYKYYYLADSSVCVDGTSCKKTHDKNEEKLIPLETRKIWMPSFGNLNDPFEFNALYLDKNRLSKTEWEIDCLEKYLESFKSSLLLTCFSENPYNNMPMWAHYANSHQGFCVKYEIVDPDLIYKVSYEGNRTAMATLITSLVTQMHYMIERDPKFNESDLRFYTELFIHSATIKHNTWEYEGEFRAIFPQMANGIHGNLVDTNQIGVNAVCVYAGLNCSTANKKRLFDISQKINCEIFEMELDDEEFSLKERQLTNI